MSILIDSYEEVFIIKFLAPLTPGKFLYSIVISYFVNSAKVNEGNCKESLLSFVASCRIFSILFLSSELRIGSEDVRLHLI
jgi:hypothetical protein